MLDINTLVAGPWGQRKSGRRARLAGAMLALLKLARVSLVAICNPKRQRLLASWASWMMSYRFMERWPQ